MVKFSEIKTDDVCETTQELEGQRNAGWPGEMLDKLISRMPPSHDFLHKCEVADYYLPFNHFLPCKCESTALHAGILNQGLTTL